MNKRFWAIITVILIIFVGFLMFGNKQDDQPTDSKTQATNHIKGNPSSKVKLVEYGDFQCPVCEGYHPYVAQLVEKYKSDIAFQFRNLPLSQVHQHAFAASRAAEAASLQDKFWEMHDLLYQNQTAWSQSPNPQTQFVSYANQLGLNVDKFKRDFASPAVNKAINNDLAAFKATGATVQTPTFFLNGKKIELKQVTDNNNTPQIEKFSKLIDEALKQQGQ